MGEQIKPCPFCGNTEVVMWESSVIPCYNIKCSKCAVRKQGINKVKAIEAWNTRPPLPDDIQRIIDKMGECDDLGICSDKGCIFVDANGCCFRNPVHDRLAEYITTRK